MASVDVELKVLCLQSRAAVEASERAKQETLAAAMENYVLAEENLKNCDAHYAKLKKENYDLAEENLKKCDAHYAKLKKDAAAELEARRAEARRAEARAHAYRLAYVQKYGREG